MRRCVYVFFLSFFHSIAFSGFINIPLDAMAAMKMVSETKGKVGKLKRLPRDFFL
jgi:hypothetical protein